MKKKKSLRPTKITRLFGNLFLSKDNKSFHEPENLNKISGISIDNENLSSNSLSSKNNAQTFEL
jgi:hypothetical protein